MDGWTDRRVLVDDLEQRVEEDLSERLWSCELTVTGADLKRRL